ncbi:MAG: urease [Erythrobacter sp. 34-65-8]|nr:MAG: urease [Erythrobacter sp. 34-65-8]
MIVLPLLLAAQVAPEAPQWNCADPLVQQEMNYCAHQDFLVADAELNAQWKLVAEVMKQRDKDVGDMLDDGRPGYFQTLLDGQRAWLRYRDAHCASEGYLARGGSMEPMLVSFCKTSLTKARTAQLRELTEIEG